MSLVNKIKLTVGVLLSFLFMFFDFSFNNGYGFIIHLGSFVVGIIFVSLVISLSKVKK